MRSKRRIHVRDIHFAEVSARLNADRPITVQLVCDDDHPDIILHLGAYMATHIIEELFAGLREMSRLVDHEIERAKLAAEGE